MISVKDLVVTTPHDDYGVTREETESNEAKCFSFGEVSYVLSISQISTIYVKSGDESSYTMRNADDKRSPTIH